MAACCRTIRSGCSTPRRARVPSFPTFGMLLVAPGQSAPLLPVEPAGAQLAPVTTSLELIKAMAETMMEAHDRLYVEAANLRADDPDPHARGQDDRIQHRTRPCPAAARVRCASRGPVPGDLELRRVYPAVPERGSAEQTLDCDRRASADANPCPSVIGDQGEGHPEARVLLVGAGNPVKQQSRTRG